MHRINPRTAGEGAGVAGPCPREGDSSQRAGLGVAALGSDSWPKAFTRAGCWEQQGWHRHTGMFVSHLGEAQPCQILKWPED